MVSWTLFVLFISLPLEQSHARFLHFFQHLAQPLDSQAKSQNQVAPSPSPVAAANANLGTDHAPAGQPTGTFVIRTCAGAPNKCQDDHINMTACFFPAHKGQEESFLLVLNNGENPLILNVNVSLENKTYVDIHIPKHDVKQINIPFKNGASSSIVLDAGTGKCTINMARSIWRGNFNFPSYTVYMTPINGAYLLGATAILIGGICICCKFRKQDRHNGHVAYEELEMGKPESRDSSVKLETNEGWDDSWDNDWDEEEAVKSPAGKPVRNRLANGFDDSKDS